MDPSDAFSELSHTKGIERVFYELCRAKPLDELNIIVCDILQ